ncbi:Colicin V production protein [Candidatus Profftia lariciata]|uniref:CvpA family protein n=1 Tax=Candidatus Profftia lariciata TaxID=1987921 RepID=UPI001D012C23|nr:CvpA family protein [Candidatus Profftia lariciata]UDG81741.1 Colicin V production protein [Candidatus Profftia lariciata]
MFWIDWVIIGIIIFSTLISLIRGFVRETLSLITWGTAFFISKNFYAYLAVYLTSFGDVIIRNGIAIIILLIATLIVGAMINYIIISLIEQTGLRDTDYILGIFFGVLRGIFIASVILFFLDTFTSIGQSMAWKKSQMIPQFSYIIRWLCEYLQSKSSFLIENLPYITTPLK